MTVDYLRKERFKLGALAYLHVLVCCISLIYVANDQAPIAFWPSTYHIFLQWHQLPTAIAVVFAFSFVSLLFCLAPFSFGYAASFYFYTMILGYLWLNCFTDLDYDHRLGGISAATCAIVFILPALFITAPIRRTDILSENGFDRLLLAILVLAALVVLASATHSYRIVRPSEIYLYRNQVELPRILRYLLETTSTTLLPFAFAGFVARKAYSWSGATLLLLLLIFPISLSKVALFTPIWLLGFAVLTSFLEGRVAAILSLLAPTLIGIILVTLFYDKAAQYFFVVNFRMIAIPSVGLDLYNYFFSKHELTYFCQISLLKNLISCPYQEPIAVMLQRAYDLGNFNASLFATEGIASVGTAFAPVSVLACGLVIAFANRLSAGLSPQFILLSGAILLQVLLNVPLTITLVTHGGIVLASLWWVTPRSLFEKRAS